MNTSYVDLYFIHYVKQVDKELTAEVKSWAEKAKAQGKIRFFGFSAHKNMENSMLAADRLGWIDGIMMSYNYRLMGKSKMKKAVDACVKAGLGLTAMKTQGGGPIKTESETEMKLAGRVALDGGTLTRSPRQATVGWLPQEPERSPDETARRFLGRRRPAPARTASRTGCFRRPSPRARRRVRPTAARRIGSRNPCAPSGRRRARRSSSRRW